MYENKFTVRGGFYCHCQPGKSQEACEEYGYWVVGRGKEKKWVREGYQCLNCSARFGDPFKYAVAHKPPSAS